MSQTLSAPAKHPRRAAWASWIGSALEYYDFVVYGTAAAVVLNHIFFPGDSPAAATLKSMVAVGVAYVVRPLGAMIMGPLGDRFGRKFVLMLTLFMMGFATFAIGCLPTHLRHRRNLGAYLAGGVPRPSGPVSLGGAGVRDFNVARTRQR